MRVGQDDPAKKAVQTGGIDSTTTGTYPTHDSHKD